METDINKVTKQIYNRLYRRGINISSELIKEEILKISPSGELSEEEKNEIVDRFAKNASELAGTKKENSEENAEIIPYSTNVNSPLNLAEAKSLVINQVEILGLDLKASEIKSIAEIIVERNLHLESAVSTAIDLISAYVKKSEYDYYNKLENNINNLINDLNDSFIKRNQKTREIFNSITAGLEVSSNHYKSDIADFIGDIEEYFKNK